MTLQELYEVNKGELKVMSGFNGKILCYNYLPNKHGDLGKRQVLSVWPEVKVIKSTLGDYAKAIMSVFVDGAEEAKKEWDKNQATV